MANVPALFSQATKYDGSFMCLSHRTSFSRSMCVALVAPRNSKDAWEVPRLCDITNVCRNQVQCHPAVHLFFLSVSNLPGLNSFCVRRSFVIVFVDSYELHVVFAKPLDKKPTILPESLKKDGVISNWQSKIDIDVAFCALDKSSQLFCNFIPMLDVPLDMGSGVLSNYQGSILVMIQFSAKRKPRSPWKDVC